MKTIYLHGFASSPLSTKARFFADRFRDFGLELDIPDLAPEGFENLTISGQLQALHRAAGEQQVSLIGSSMGGYLAALYAARHRSVARLILLAPAFAFSRRWPEALGPAAMDNWQRTGALTVYHYGDRRRRELGYRLVTDGAQYEDFPDFHQPALILHGRQDPVVPLGLSEQFVASHPNATLVALDSGHELTDVLPLLWQQSESFLGLTRPVATKIHI